MKYKWQLFAGNDYNHPRMEGEDEADNEEDALVIAVEKTGGPHTGERLEIIVPEDLKGGALG